MHAPAHKLWVLDNCLPTGELIGVTPDKDLRTWRPIGTSLLDDVYTDVRPIDGAIECVMRDPAAGLEIAQLSDSIFRELVVFTPPNRHAVCMEPYTCVTDAINCQQRGMDAGCASCRREKKSRPGSTSSCDPFSGEPSATCRPTCVPPTRRVARPDQREGRGRMLGRGGTPLRGAKGVVERAFDS